MPLMVQDWPACRTAGLPKHLSHIDRHLLHIDMVSDNVPQASTEASIGKTAQVCVWVCSLQDKFRLLPPTPPQYAQLLSRICLRGSSTSAPTPLVRSYCPLAGVLPLSCSTAVQSCTAAAAAEALCCPSLSPTEALPTLQWAMLQCPPLGGTMSSVQTHWAMVEVRSLQVMHRAQSQGKSTNRGVPLQQQCWHGRAFRKVCRGLMHCLSLNAASFLLLADARQSRSKLGLIVGLTVSFGVPLLLLSLAALVGGTVLLGYRRHCGASFEHKQSASSVLTDELQVQPLPLPRCMWRLMRLGRLLAAGQCRTAGPSKPPHHLLSCGRFTLSEASSVPCFLMGHAASAMARGSSGLLHWSVAANHCRKAWRGLCKTLQRQDKSLSSHVGASRPVLVGVRTLAGLSLPTGPFGYLTSALLHHTCRTCTFKPPTTLHRCPSAATGATATPALQGCSAVP